MRSGKVKVQRMSAIQNRDSFFRVQIQNVSHELGKRQSQLLHFV
jgi:hypothetical protein